MLDEDNDEEDEISSQEENRNCDYITAEERDDATAESAAFPER